MAKRQNGLSPKRARALGGFNHAGDAAFDKARAKDGRLPPTIYKPASAETPRPKIEQPKPTEPASGKPMSLKPENDRAFDKAPDPNKEQPKETHPPFNKQQAGTGKVRFRGSMAHAFIAFVKT